MFSPLENIFKNWFFFSFQASHGVRKQSSDFEEEFCKLDRPWLLSKEAMIQPKVPGTCNGFVLVPVQVDSPPHLFPLVSSSQHFHFLENSFSQNAASSACPSEQRSLREKLNMRSAGHWISCLHPAGKMEAVCVSPWIQLVLGYTVKDWKRNLLKWTQRACGCPSSHLFPCNLQSISSFL